MHNITQTLWLRKQSRQEKYMHSLPLFPNASSLLLHAFVMLACTQKGENKCKWTESCGTVHRTTKCPAAAKGFEVAVNIVASQNKVSSQVNDDFAVVFNAMLNIHLIHNNYDERIVN